MYNLNGKWMTKAAISMVVPLGTDLSKLPHVTGVFNLVAFVIILIVTAILVIGIQESANFNTLIVIVKLTCVVVFLVLGINFLIHHPDLAKMNWHPSFRPRMRQGTSASAALRRARPRSSLRISASTRSRRRRRRRRIRSAICRSASWARW